MDTPWLVVLVLGASAAYFTVGTVLKRSGRGLYAGTRANPVAENWIMAVQWGLTVVALVVALAV